MALKNPRKQHHGTFNPYPSGVFTRYESKVIGSIFLLKPLLALLGLEDIVDSVCPLASNRASVSVGEVCKILVLNPSSTVLRHTRTSKSRVALGSWFANRKNAHSCRHTVLALTPL